MLGTRMTTLAGLETFVFFFFLKKPFPVSLYFLAIQTIPVSV